MLVQVLCANKTVVEESDGTFHRQRGQTLHRIDPVRIICPFGGLGNVQKYQHSGSVRGPLRPAYLSGSVRFKVGGKIAEVVLRLGMSSITV